MKKLILFFILLFLPISLGIIALLYLFPQDFKSVVKLAKEKAVAIYPPLQMYIKIDNETKKKVEVLPPPEKKVVPNLHHFTNAEIYAPICGVMPKEKLSEKFTACPICPKYLDNETVQEKFIYLSETRGIILKKDEEEAIIFMKGCSKEKENGIAIVLRKGFGGWQKQTVFQGVLFDSHPLEFKDQSGFYLFVGKRTVTLPESIREELISMRLQNKELLQRVLFTATIDRREKCDRPFQAAFDGPTKKNDFAFHLNLEVIGCKKDVLSGSFKLNFNLSDDLFKPNSESSSLMTKLEKYGESK